MEYAPILDPAAYTSRTEPRRRLALAASVILQAMASDVPTLRSAIDILSGAASDDVALGQIENLAVVHAIVGDHPTRQDVLKHLVEQLRQVKAFGELDGGTVEQYVGPVSRLIQSGRVELFAGRSARAA